MDPEHRQILAQKCDEVCGTVTLQDVESHLKHHKLFNRYMWQDINSMYDVFGMLPTRGPDAFRTFVKVLKDTGFDMEAKLLEDEEKPDITYRFGSQPKGACFLVNNYKFQTSKLEDRTGSDKDSESLVKFFKSIKYEVYDYANLDFLDFNKYLDDFVKKCKTIDIILVILMSHGSTNERGEYISDIKGRQIYKDRILEKLNNFESPHLQGKPKMFFFIACRGSKRDYGVEPSVYTDTVPTEVGPINRTPTTSDMLLVHSTLPGQVSMRDDLGSWFCRDLLHYLPKYYNDHDVEDIMKMVNVSLTKRVSLEHGTQVLEVVNRKFLTLYLCGNISDKQ